MIGNNGQSGKLWLVVGGVTLVVGLAMRLNGQKGAIQPVARRSPAAAMAQADRARALAARAQSQANGQQSYHLEIETGQ